MVGNTFVDNDRAIALGLINRANGSDHQGGVIRDNFIVMRPGLFSAWRSANSDAPILAWDSPSTQIDHNTIYTRAASTQDRIAPQRPGAADRVAATWYSGTSFTVDVNLTDGRAHRVSAYAMDWDGGGSRSQRVEVLDAATGAVVDGRTLSSFSGGSYLSWTLSGHVQLRFTRLAGVNAVLSGLFFGPAV